MVRADGGWLFISHSHEDIAQVRQIRNFLEDEGFNPIVFFLKSKTNKWTLNRLIKKEIKARKWFVLADSPASRYSSWVKKEIRYATKLKDKTIITIDLTRDLKPQLLSLVRRTRVFLSYSHKDQELVNLVYQKLIENDFQVWLDEKELQVGTSLFDQIHEAIDDHKKNGIFLCFVTEHSVISHHFMKELNYALSQNLFIVLALTSDVDLTPELSDILSGVHKIIPLMNHPTNEYLDVFVRALIEISGEKL